MYSSILSLTSALDGVGGQRHAPAALLPGKRPCTPSTGGWVGPRAGLDGCGKSLLRRISIPGQSSPQRVAIPTELPRPTAVTVTPAPSILNRHDTNINLIKTILTYFHLSSLLLSPFLHPLTQQHLPQPFHNRLRSLPRLQVKFTMFACLNPRGWIFSNVCDNLSCGIMSTLYVHQCVREFLMCLLYSKQMQVLNLLYHHDTLSHPNKYIIRHFFKFSPYSVLVLCRKQDYIIKNKRNLTKPFIFQQTSSFMVYRLKSHPEDSIKNHAVIQFYL